MREQTEHIKNLAVLIARGSGRVLVGAGSSIDCGYLGWKPFLAKLEAAAGPALPAAMSENLLLRADAIQDVLPEEQMREIFHSTFHPSGATKTPPEWLKLLFELRCRFYLTTNYTSELEDLSRPLGFEEALRWYDPETSALLREVCKQRVLYLHGRYDDDPVPRDQNVQVVLGEKSYRFAHVAPGAKARKILATVLETGTLLIAGASLEDRDFRNGLREALAEAKGTEYPHYVLYPLRPNEGHKAQQVEMELRSELNLQPLFFHVEVDDDGDNFDDLTRIIQELVDTVELSSSGPLPIGGQERDRPEDVEFAWALTRLLPSLVDYIEIAQAMGAGTSPSDIQRSPMDRWHVLVGIARHRGAVEKLRGLARKRLPKRRAGELERGRGGARSELTDRARIEAFLGPFMKPYFGPRRSAPAESSLREAFGLLALDRYWGNEPIHPQIEHWISRLDGDAEVFTLAYHRGEIKEGGEFTDLDLGLAFAADFLARAGQEQPDLRRDLLEWALPRLAAFGAFRHEILVLLLAWSPPAESHVTEFLERGLERTASNPISRLLELTFAERLQREAGLPPSAKQLSEPIALQWARRANLGLYVAFVLETLGERNVEVYLEHWKRATGPARMPLARAILRCARPGSPVGERILDLAIEATRADVSTKRVLALVANSRVRRVWFDILPVDPKPPQIEAMGALLATRGRRAERDRSRIVELLCHHPDTLLVWKLLGEQRKEWIESLDPPRLPPPALATLTQALAEGRLSGHERADLDRLRHRWAQTEERTLEGPPQVDSGRGRC